MIARYDGRCDRCGKRIYADVDEIQMTPENAWDRGAWHHEDCNDLKQISHTCQSSKDFFAECAGCKAGIQPGEVRGLVEEKV